MEAVKPAMHLRDALVDLRGTIFGEGTISFLPDPSGTFAAPTHTHVAIDRSGQILRPAEAKRDPRTGFVLPTILSPVVHLPNVLGRLLTTCVKYRSGEPKRLSLSHNDGMITIGNGREQKAQHLTDWRIEIAEVEDGVRILASAALWSTQAWPLSDKPPTNHWANHGEPFRLVVDVVVSNPTRSAIGAYTSGIGNTASVGGADYPRTDIATLSLGHAPVGAINTYAIGPADEWFSIAQINGDGRPTISFNRLNGAPPRLAGGVIGLPTYGYREDAHLFFRGWDLTSVAMQLVHATSLTVRMKGRESIGELVQDHRLFEGVSPRPMQHIIESRFDFALDRRGLTIKYDVLVHDLDWRKAPYQPGRLRAEMYLCWEVLILNVPAFLSSRKLLPDGLVHGGRTAIFEDGLPF